MYSYCTISGSNTKTDVYFKVLQEVFVFLKCTMVFLSVQILNLARFKNFPNMVAVNSGKKGTP